MKILRTTVYLFLLSTVPAFAYVDPGSGSILLSLILGLLASIAFFFKGIWYRIRRMFVKREDNKK